jgi:hypothetical protein
MTHSEIQAEWDHLYHTRLGILCEDRVPTPEQEQIARTEADAAVRELKEQG